MTASLSSPRFPPHAGARSPFAPVALLVPFVTLRRAVLGSLPFAMLSRSVHDDLTLDQLLHTVGFPRRWIPRLTD